MAGNRSSQSLRADYHERVALGYVDTPSGAVHKIIHKFGRNAAVAGTYTDIWTPGGTRTWQTSAGVVTLTSTLTTDTAAGNGARTVTVEGLDANWDEQSETITMNGTGGATGTKSFIRLNRMYVATCGTYGSTTSGANLGIITATIGGVTQCQIAVNGTGTGQSEQVHYSVPANYWATVHNFSIATDNTSKTMDLLFLLRTDADVVSAPFSARRNVLSYHGVVDSSFSYSTDAPFAFPGKSDLWVAGRVSASTVAINVNYEIHLIPYEYE